MPVPVQPPVLQPICPEPAVYSNPALVAAAYASAANAMPLGAASKVNFQISAPRKPATRAVVDPTRPAAPAPAPRQQGQQQQQGQGWPQSLKDYVARAFVVCGRDGTRDGQAMERALKTMIDNAIRNNALYTTAWDTMAVPAVARLSAGAPRAAAAAARPGEGTIAPAKGNKDGRASDDSGGLGS